MANIGLSQPYYAMYAETNGVVTYTGLKKLGKATTVNVSIDNKDPEKLFADNGVAESVWQFSSGTVTMGVDELQLAVAADIWGLELSGTNNNRITFKADSLPPYVGLGFIVKKVYENTIKYRVVVFYKAQFTQVDYSIDTQGETVSFQTPEVDATIMRDDTTDHKWQDWGDYETEAAALTALQTALGG